MPALNQRAFAFSKGFANTGTPQPQPNRPTRPALNRLAFFIHGERNDNRKPNPQRLHPGRPALRRRLPPRHRRHAQAAHPLGGDRNPPEGLSRLRRRAAHPLRSAILPALHVLHLPGRLHRRHRPRRRRPFLPHRPNRHVRLEARQPHRPRSPNEGRTGAEEGRGKV